MCWDGAMVKLVTWSQYRGVIGDRSGLFRGVAELVPVERALYPGSYVDLAPSTAIKSVTYLDMDKRADKFFGAQEVVAAELAGRTRPGGGEHVEFIFGDYAEQFDVPEGSVDLIISLYAGIAWPHTRQCLRPGGWLLANASHGEASLAALDPGLRLVAAVRAKGDDYRLLTDDLDRFLIPKRPEQNNPEAIKAEGRGPAYTQRAFAYLFQAD